MHDYWEEVYLISGDLVVGDGKNGAAAESFCPNTYACRPPRISHGPGRWGTGCVLFEISLLAESARSGPAGPL